MFYWILIVGGLLIMMRQHDRSEALFYYFRLEDQIRQCLSNNVIGPTAERGWGSFFWRCKGISFRPLLRTESVHGVNICSSLAAM
jgi:hypothetical protein